MRLTGPSSSPLSVWVRDSTAVMGIVEVACDILRGDLEGVEEKARAARVNAGGTERVEDLGEGDLDGAAVFEDGEPE